MIESLFFSGCCSLPSEVWQNQICSKVLLIALTVAHCRCCSLPSPTVLHKSVIQSWLVILKSWFFVLCNLSWSSLRSLIFLRKVWMNRHFNFYLSILNLNFHSPHNTSTAYAFSFLYENCYASLEFQDPIVRKFQIVRIFRDDHLLNYLIRSQIYDFFPQNNFQWFSIDFCYISKYILLYLG